MSPSFSQRRREHDENRLRVTVSFPLRTLLPLRLCEKYSLEFCHD